MNAQELTGRVRSHVLDNNALQFTAEKETAEAFFAMRAAASAAGFDLIPYSAFRDFNSQARIWNLKYSGQRQLYDPDGQPLNRDALESSELIHCILNWSALPGGSRHHWGTDIDVIDGSVTDKGYQVKLLPDEYNQDGVFHEMNCWLNENLDQYGFFRPYAEYQGGVCAEPWHISYMPVSGQALVDLKLEMIRDAIQESSLLGKELVLERLPTIFEKYILNISK